MNKTVDPVVNPPDDKQTIEKTDKGQNDKKEKWGTKMQFILTCLGYVIGYGNIWRFPYICYKNGGGAFLIPYFLSLVFLGLPIMIIEMTLGQYSAKGKVVVWKFMPIFFGIGISMMIAVSMQAVYYNMLVAWSIYYFLSSFTTGYLPWKECGHAWNTWRCTNGSINETYRSPSDEYLHENVLQINSDMEDITDLNIWSVVCLIIAWLLVVGALYNGIETLGKISYFTALFPYCCLTILLIRGLALEGALEGIKFYMIPKFERLLDLNVWVDASQQIFFSLGVSWGMIITMSSHNDFQNHLITDAVIIAFGNSLTSIFAGFVVFSYMGYMAHQRNVEVSEVATKGPGLAFILYPEAVSKFPFGQLFSITFFFMLILLGMGSQTPIIESVLSTLLDLFPSKRKKRPIILCLICVICFNLGLIFCTKSGIYWFELFSGFCASTPAMIIGFAEIVAISWVYGIDRFFDNIKEMVGDHPKMTTVWKFIMKYVTPIYLFIILVLTLYTTEEPTYRSYKFPKWTIIMGWIINFGSVAPIPIVAVYYLHKCYFHESLNLKDVSSPEIDWKSEHANRTDASPKKSS